MSRFSQPKWLILVTVGLCVVGVSNLVASRRIEREARAVKRMTCDELLKLGAAAPSFVTLTDARLCGQGHAFRRDMDAAMEMYVPIYSAKLAKEPPPADLALLLEIFGDRERDELLADAAPAELTVELWTDARDLDVWVADQLAPWYPGLRLARCRVLSVGLHEPTLLRAERAWRDGWIMFLLAAVVPAGWFEWRRFGKFAQSHPAVQANHFCQP